MGPGNFPLLEVIFAPLKLRRAPIVRIWNSGRGLPRLGYHQIIISGYDRMKDISGPSDTT